MMMQFSVTTEFYDTWPNCHHCSWHLYKCYDGIIVTKCRKTEAIIHYNSNMPLT